MRRNSMLALIMSVIMVLSIAFDSSAVVFAMESGQDAQTFGNELLTDGDINAAAEEEADLEVQDSTESADAQEPFGEIIVESVEEGVNLEVQDSIEPVDAQEFSEEFIVENVEGEEAVKQAVLPIGQGDAEQPAEIDGILAEENDGEQEGVLYQAGEDGTYGNFSYRVEEEGTVTITHYTEKEENVTVPAEIEGHPVTAIGDSAFADCRSLTQVMLPDSVTTIGDSAFNWCESLTQIMLPDSVTTIGEKAFEECISLIQISIPAGVKSIERGTFLRCRSLTQVTIPDSVATIGEEAFEECVSLTQISIPAGVKSIERGTFLMCSSLTQIAIPDSVTIIGWGAFAGCESLTQISIPKGVTEIGEWAFSDCRSFTQIPTFPSSVIVIGNYTFCGCTSLTRVIIPDHVTTIGEGAFWGCTALTQITIPDNVTTIAESAFRYCKSLAQIALPSGIIEIAAYTFFDCSSLTQINIPEGVTAIGKETFRSCSSLRQIVLPRSATKIGEYAFEECKLLTQITFSDSVAIIGTGAFWSCTSLSQITIPDSVGTIGYSAFRDCTSLTQITLPTYLTEIGYCTFSGCKSLKEISIPVGVSNIGEDAFSDCELLKSIYFYGDAPQHSSNSFPTSNALTLYVLRDKSGWTVPTYESWNSAYFSVKEELDPIPSVGELDYTAYQADYTQVFEEFMTDRYTNVALRTLVRNENFPAFFYVYTNDQKIGSYITAAITDVLFRGYQGIKDMTTAEVSKEYTKKVLIALLGQKETEIQGLVEAKEAHKMREEISDGFDNFLRRAGMLFAISEEDRENLEKFFHSDTIDTKLRQGKYTDLKLMFYLRGYKDSTSATKVLDAFQKSSEMSKILSDALKVEGQLLDTIETSSDIIQTFYRYQVALEADRVYMDILSYIRDNAKYSVVQEAAGEILSVLNTEAETQKQKVIFASIQRVGEQIKEEAFKEALSGAVKLLPYGKVIEKAYSLSKSACNSILGTSNYQEKYDNLRVIAYIGDAIGQWTIGNYLSYFQAGDLSQKNVYARNSYFGLHFLLNTRKIGEETLQGLWKGMGKISFQKSDYYRSSVIRSGLLKVDEQMLFTPEREQAFCATAMACPVDVKIYDPSGQEILTVVNGQEIPLTTAGDITYTEHLNPGTGEYDKIVILPKDAGYSLKGVGTGLGTMDIHTVDMSTDVIVDKYLQNIPVTSSTTVVILDPSGEDGTVTLMAGDESLKTTVELQPRGETYVPVTGLVVEHDMLELNEGEASLVSASVQPGNATDQNIVWSSASDDIASVSPEGVVTGTGAGQTTLIASAEDGSVTATLAITILKSDPSPGEDGGQQGKPDQGSGKTGSSGQIVRPQQIHTHRFTSWRTSSKATVFLPEVQTRTCTCGQTETRRVGGKLSPTICLNAKTIVLKQKQKTYGLQVTGLAAGDYVQSWQSGNPKIATVTGGMIKAGRKTGKTKLTVTLASGLQKTVTVKVQKKAVEAKKITGLPKRLALKKGESIQLVPGIQPFTCTAKKRYASSRGKVVKVSGKGLVTARKKGKATITVRCGKKKVKIRVTVH